MDDFTFNFEEEPVAYRSDISYHDAVTALQEIQLSMQALVKAADDRMIRLEGNISNIIDTVSRSTIIPVAEDEDVSDDDDIDFQADSATSEATSPCELDCLPCNTTTNTTNLNALSLKIVGLDTRWYTKRPMAPFQIQLVDGSDKIVHTSDSDDYSVVVHLVSGHGVVVDQYLANSDDLTFPIIDGRADISSLRFLAVSSRNGGHFRLQFCANGPKVVTSAESDDIEILSERLKNEHKAESILNLHADDALVRVPGIGKKYAQKLSQQGLHTIRDLANIDSSPEARTRRLDILAAVRRDRGALTEAKLVEMLRDAKAVVKRERGSVNKVAPDTDFPIAKKQKIDVVVKKEKPALDISAEFAFDPSSFMNISHCFQEEVDHAFMF
jgi:predicted flap endonuclease-1-like 5' DNA nuclease